MRPWSAIRKVPPKASVRGSGLTVFGAVAFPRGHILHDFLEARIFPRIVGPIGRGRLQYTAMWKVAQRMTGKNATEVLQADDAGIARAAHILDTAWMRASNSCEWKGLLM